MDKYEKLSDLFDLIVVGAPPFDAAKKIRHEYSREKRAVWMEMMDLLNAEFSDTDPEVIGASSVRLKEFFRDPSLLSSPPFETPGDWLKSETARAELPPVVAILTMKMLLTRYRLLNPEDINSPQFMKVAENNKNIMVR